MKASAEPERTIVYRYNGNKICGCRDNPICSEGIVHTIVRQDFSIYIRDLDPKLVGKIRLNRRRRREKPEAPKPPGEAHSFLTRFGCRGCKQELSTYAIVAMDDWKEGRFKVITDSAEEKYRKDLKEWETSQQ